LAAPVAVYVAGSHCRGRSHARGLGHGAAEQGGVVVGQRRAALRVCAAPRRRLLLLLLPLLLLLLHLLLLLSLLLLVTVVTADTIPCGTPTRRHRHLSATTASLCMSEPWVIVEDASGAAVP
jgi:hypothetical protein